MSNLFIVSNENGFLSGVSFDKKQGLINPTYTQDQKQALVCFPRFEYCLNHKINNFDFLKSNTIKLEDQFSDLAFEEMKKTGKIEKQIYTFKEDLAIERKVKSINKVRACFMDYQQELINFFTNASFKQCGELMKKDKSSYDALRDKITSRIQFASFKWCGDNIWFSFRDNGVEQYLYIIMKDGEDQEVKTLEKITVSKYKKALSRIKANEKKIADLKSEISSLQIANYL